MNLRRSRESRTRTGSGRLVKAVAWVGVASLVLGWVVDRAWGQGGPAGSGRMTSASNLVDRMPLSSPPAAMGGGGVGVAARPLRVELGGPRPQGAASLGRPSLPPPRRFPPRSAAAGAPTLDGRSPARASRPATAPISTSRVLVGPRGGVIPPLSASGGERGTEPIVANPNFSSAGVATTEPAAAATTTAPSGLGGVGPLMGAPAIDPLWVVAPFGGNLPTATYLWTQRQHEAQRQAYHNRYGTAAAGGPSARPTAIPASRAFRNGAPGRFDQRGGYFDTIGGRR